MATIGEVGGIGEKFARQLRKAGIKTSEGLLKSAALRKERVALCAKVGATPEQLLEWVNRADLMRVKGIGAEYSDLLECCGVDTVKELKLRNPKALTAAMVEYNEKKRLVRRLPTESMVTAWIEAAKNLPAVVKH